MKQQKTTPPERSVIDRRKREDLLSLIRALSKAYTPEWQFDIENPDMGSVIALLFIEQMQENIGRLNGMMDNYYVELINMLDISLKPAYPAHSFVSMQLIRDTVSGFRLPRRTKLLGRSDDGNDMVFETAYGIYVTESRLVKAFMASGFTGKMVSVLEGKPFRLFDFSGEESVRTGLMLYHTHLFDVQDSDIRMRIEGNDTLAGQIVRGQYRLYYYTQSGFELISDIRIVERNLLAFRKEKECKKVNVEGGIYSAILLAPASPLMQNVTASEIRFSSAGQAAAPEYVANQSMELEVSAFLPFGRNLSLFDELFVGHPYFGKPQAVVTLDFSLEYQTVGVMPPQNTESPDLRIIKRKPYKALESALADVYADEISLSYYNGAGWKKLGTFLPISQIFQNGKEGLCQIQFTCPADWKKTEIGGYAGYCIRIQLVRADNCYYQPALHHVPVIKNLTAAYTYENNFERPDYMVSYRGNRKKEITNVPILFGSPYDSTSLYLGFDRKMEDGPVSLLFQIDGGEGTAKNRFVFSYSTRNGFSKLKITDKTENLSHTGTILFMPPSDWAETKLEEETLYWLKITDEGQDLENNPEKQPKVFDITLNAVEIDNIETLEEESYYIDNYEPNMEFALNARNVLCVDVWVNETEKFSRAEMERLALAYPDDVKAEYNSFGEISEFYVRWSERDNFDRSKPNDRHFVVDRMNRMLYFGDGVHVEIPRNTKGAAFRTVVRCCDGERANIGRNQVTDAFDDILFVEKMSNPVQAFGGMDMESAEEALRRGSAMINNRRRLISMLDYEREVLAFSRKIAQVRAVTGKKGAVTLVLLMEDYQEGRFSFVNLKPRLKQYLCTQCELSVDSTKLEIAEPMFLEISVEAWIRVLCADERFMVQQTFIHMLQTYLNPVKNDCWEIGHIPAENQIVQRLNMEKGNALIDKMMVTAKYRDENGKHETDLDAFAHNPYVIVTSGEHKIHIEQ